MPRAASSSASAGWLSVSFAAPATIEQWSLADGVGVDHPGDRARSEHVATGADDGSRVDDLAVELGGQGGGALAVHVGDQHGGAVGGQQPRQHLADVPGALDQDAGARKVQSAMRDRGADGLGHPDGRPARRILGGARHGCARLADQGQVGDGGAHVHAGQVVAARAGDEVAEAAHQRGPVARRAVGHDHRLGAAERQLGHRVLERHGRGQPAALGDRVDHAGVRLEAHAAQSRPQRGVVDHYHALQAHRQVLADDLAPSLTPFRVRGPHSRGHRASPPNSGSLPRGVAPLVTSATHAHVSHPPEHEISVLARFGIWLPRVGARDSR